MTSSLPDQLVAAFGPRTPARSRRTNRALALFGLEPAPSTHRSDRDRALLALHLLEAISPGQVLLITGPSGGGKSRLLLAIEAALNARSTRFVRLSPDSRSAHPPHASVVDALPGPLGRALAALAAAGLADARLYASRLATLSDGEFARWQLARAILTLPPRGVLLADEFCAPLDFVTTRSVCAAMTRWTRRTGSRLICAGARDDLLEALSPDGLVHLNPDQPPLVLLPEKDLAAQSCQTCRHM